MVTEEYRKRTTETANMYRAKFPQVSGYSDAELDRSIISTNKLTRQAYEVMKPLEEADAARIAAKLPELPECKAAREGYYEIAELYFALRWERNLRDLDKGE